ncbi:MAG: hypothetical protein J3R72DRAFT_65850 [Linnemannia gamsii]|nr:MAG: hypothetical protein J3R72DRAFT_65850 [Linnemannia gamsii]
MVDAFPAMDTAIKEWATHHIMAEQAWVAWAALLAGTSTSTQSFRTALEARRFQEVHLDWTVPLVNSRNHSRNNSLRDSPTRILTMVNHLVGEVETNPRGLDPKTDSTMIVSTVTNSTTIGSRDGRDQGSNGSEQGRRTDNSYRSSGSSEREPGLGQGSSTSKDFGRRSNDGGSGNWSGDSPRHSQPQPHSPLPSYSNRGSPAIGGGSPGSITSRLTPGIKRPGGAMEDSQKAQKSSGSSTPRSEQSRSSSAMNQGYGSDSGSVSFLRDRRDDGDDSPQHRQPEPSNSNAVPTGFVKVENIPESVSDASVRQLANGISGVGRVLTVSKKGDRTVVLGFASVEEAKFFRRQINRFAKILVTLSCCFVDLHVLFFILSSRQKYCPCSCTNRTVCSFFPFLFLSLLGLPSKDHWSL